MVWGLMTCELVIWCYWPEGLLPLLLLWFWTVYVGPAPWTVGSAVIRRLCLVGVFVATGNWAVVLVILGAGSS